MRLAAKLMLVFLVVVMLQTALASYFSVRRAFERFEERQQQLASQLAEELDDDLAAAWRDRGVDGLSVAIEETRPRRGDMVIHWVWFEPYRMENGGSLFTIVEQRVAETGRIITTTDPNRAKSRMLQTYHPIDLQDAPRGGLEITASLAAVEQETRATIVTSLVSLGAMGFLVFGLVWIAGVRWIARPLDRLIEKTKRIGAGDFSQPLAVRGNDELSQLAGALNDMSAQLAGQQQRILAETSERMRTVEQLRHADRLKTVGRLAAGIAHELGTPLNVVSGRAGLIASGKLTPEEVAGSARTIISESDRIANIIRQLLDFARQNAASSEAVNIGDLLRQTASLLQPIAESRGVTIELPRGADRTITADSGKLQQVLTNILVNGMQAMARGGRIVVELGTAWTKPREAVDATKREYLTIAITDQGCGIAVEHLENIFEPFFTTKDVGEGTGLGLSIAHGIIEEHGGWIDVASTPGKGSCFTIYLPEAGFSQESVE